MAIGLVVNGMKREVQLWRDHRHPRSQRRRQDDDVLHDRRAREAGGRNGTFRGEDITRLPVYVSRAKGLGYLAQEAKRLPQLSVWDNVMAIARAFAAFA